MSKALLEIQNLHVRVEEKEILHGVDLTVGQDETHVLMGPNGTGKSTLGYAITGNPTYSVTGGSIILTARTSRAPRQRAREKGHFPVLPESAGGPRRDAERVHPQRAGAEDRRPPAPVGLQEKAQGDHGAFEHGRELRRARPERGLFRRREEKGRNLQMLMLEPKLAILDETDSGLDVDAVRTVSEGVRLFRERTHGSLLIITHSTRILEALHVDAAHVMEEGVIVRNGGAELVDEINERDSAA